MSAFSLFGCLISVRAVMSVSIVITALTNFASIRNANAQQPEADFYKGKQIRFIIRSDPGGGFDLYSRLLGTFLVRHIRGNPTFIPQNMPGGGGIQALNYMAKVAPKDGTYLTIIGETLPLEQSLGYTPLSVADLTTFGWIGNLTRSNVLSYTWHTSPVKTMADAEKAVAKMGNTGVGGPAGWLPALYNKVLGTKFQVINGYGSGTEVKLAMERGEVDGYCNPWAALISANPELVRDHLISIFVQAGVQKEKELPDVPLLSDFATNAEDRMTLDFISRSVSIGRAIGTTPGVPAARLAILRKAFDDTLVDPDFRAEAAKEGALIAPMDGATLQQSIEEVLNTPQAIRDRVKAAIPEQL